MYAIAAGGRGKTLSVLRSLGTRTLCSSRPKGPIVSGEVENVSVHRSEEETIERKAREQVSTLSISRIEIPFRTTLEFF